MKIIHISFSDNFGGANIAAVRLNNSLKKKIDSRLIVYNKKKKDKNILKFKDNSFLTHKGKNYISKLILLLFNKKNNNSLNIFSSNLVNIINQSDADIVHLHWINNELLSIKDISRINKKIVWTAHDMWPFCGSEHYSYDKKYFKIYKKRENNYLNFDISKLIWFQKKKYYSKKINFIAPSLWMKNKIEKSTLCKDNPTYLVRNPIDTSIWKFRKCSKKKNKIILAICAYDLFNDQRKGFIELINKLNNFNFNFNLEIYAIGKQDKLEIKSKIKIKYFGYIKNENKISKIFNKCDALLMPSEADNFPNVGVEALASGLPIITLNNNGINEILLDGYNGLKIDSFNNKTFEKIFKWLNELKSKKKNFKIANSTKKIVSYKKISNEMIKIYKKILNE